MIAILTDTTAVAIAVLRLYIDMMKEVKEEIEDSTIIARDQKVTTSMREYT